MVPLMQYNLPKLKDEAKLRENTCHITKDQYLENTKKYKSIKTFLIDQRILRGNSQRRKIKMSNKHLKSCVVKKKIKRMRYGCFSLIDQQKF